MFSENIIYLNCQHPGQYSVDLFIFKFQTLLVISFREETLDLPGHGPPEGAAPSPLLATGLPRARLAPHGVVHSLRDLYLHLLVCLVRPQPLTLDADHPLGLGPASVSALRPPLSLWCPWGVDADPRRGWASSHGGWGRPRPRLVAGDAAHACVTPRRGQCAGVWPEAAVPVIPGRGHRATSVQRLLGDRGTRRCGHSLGIVLDCGRRIRGRWELAETGQGGDLHDAGHGPPGGPGGGLHVHHSAYLLGHSQRLNWGHQGARGRVGGRPPVTLTPDQDNGRGRGLEPQLGHPVIQTREQGPGVSDGVAQQEHVSLAVGQGPHSARLEAAAGVPQHEPHHPGAHHLRGLVTEERGRGVILEQR